MINSEITRKLWYYKERAEALQQKLDQEKLQIAALLEQAVVKQLDVSDIFDDDTQNALLDWAQEYIALQRQLMLKELER